MMDEIDTKTNVLEPTHPTRSSNTRRIMLDRNISLQIEVRNPLNPRDQPPRLEFFGAASKTEPLRQALIANIASWNANTSILSNLKHILKIDMTVPKASSSTNPDHFNDDLQISCVICYSYKFQDTFPDSVCEACTQNFHQMCLLQWLRSVPNFRQSFNVIFGECPYCSKSIAVKVTF